MIPERWLVVRARIAPDPDLAPDEADGLLADALLGIGGRAVSTEDGWAVTHLPLGEGAPPGADEIHARLADRYDGTIAEVRTGIQAHEDWAELWKVGLEPRRLTDRIVVTPSWKTPELREGDLVITVDPGMAFGNAEHGTTRGCIRILDGTVREGDLVLDVGAGSAILAVAAALLGAAEVLALEADELAIETARENAERNGVADRVTVERRFVTADGLAAGPAWDLVVANIEVGLLRPILPGLVAATRPGGSLLLSGILDHEWPAFRDEVEAAGAVFEEVDADGEWRSARFLRGG